MSRTSPQPPVPMQRGRRDDRFLLARLRAERPWAFRHREQRHVEAGLLVIRVAVGATFLAHGLDKLVDISAATRFFESLGLPASAWLAPLVGVTETVGGLLLIAGLATPLAGAALAGDMVVAYLTAHLGHGFFASEGGGELVLLLGAACVTFVFAGAGRFSLGSALSRRAARSAVARRTSPPTRG